MTLLTQEVPRWPTGLREDNMLPYETWRVLSLVDGQRSIGQIANELQLSPEEVERLLDLARDWTSRALRHEQTITSAIIDSVTQALVSVVGPMGEFVVDDALEAVGTQATLSVFLGSIAPELEETHLHQFIRQLRSRGLT